MYNLFGYLLDKLFDEKNAVETGTGLLYGYYISISFILPFDGMGVISWELIIRSLGGIVVAVITALALNLGKDFYEIKVKHRIFKVKKHGKKETDTEKRA